jgi:hypothetical protein
VAAVELQALLGRRRAALRDQIQASQLRIVPKQGPHTEGEVRPTSRLAVTADQTPSRSPTMPETVHRALDRP